MGTDKGLIQYHGVPQRQFIFELLSAFCDRVFVSCKEGQQVPAELNPLVDTLEMESPLNGIVSAFRQNHEVAWITVPVDMPNINKESIDQVLASRDEASFATCFFDSSGKRPEPLFTVWEKKCYPALEKFVAGGGISPRIFLETHPHKALHVTDSFILKNVNSRTDLEKFKHRE